MVQEFNQQLFQVLCATESYEVGVHNPHVELVAWVGCMRNMNVLLQKFGRAGRSEEKGGVGLLMINEHRDDQHLGYWLDGCDASEVTRIKEEYQECWNWIYSVYTGDCLRKEILKYYNEYNARTRLSAEDCCLCCESAIPKDFDIQKQLLLLLNAVAELEGAIQKNNIGIAENKLIS